MRQRGGGGIARGAHSPLRAGFGRALPNCSITCMRKKMEATLKKHWRHNLWCG